jgi:sialidase-1
MNYLLPVALLVTICGGLSAAESGLHEERIDAVVQGEPLIWRDFDKGQPAESVAVAHEVDGVPTFPDGRTTDFWAVRHPGWAPMLLNARGNPPDLTLDPGREEVCNVYLGLRAVDPVMSFGIRLSSEKEFTTITAPAATPTQHFDFEFHWKAQVPMKGEQIVVRSLGKPVYIQYLKFVPQVTRTTTALVPDEHFTVISERGRHLAFPGVAQVSGGDLLAVCREGDAHVCPRGRIVLARSTDLGRTWSPRAVIYDSPSDDRDPAVITLHDGTVVCSFNTWDSWRGSPGLRSKYAAETAHMEQVGWGKYSGSWLMVSTDQGRTWSERRKAPVFSPRGPVQGPDGALYWVGLEGRDGARVTAIWRTMDLGLKWERFSEVCYGPAQGDPTATIMWDEPNMVFLPGDRALCTLRVECGGNVWQAASANGGHTWSWPRKLPVWGFPQQLCALSDGRLLMGYGYRQAPLGIRACLSADQGRTWNLEREIIFRHQGATGDLGYPYTIQLADGSLYTVYYYNDAATDCHIEGVRYRP